MSNQTHSNENDLSNKTNWTEIAEKAWEVRKMRMLYESLESELFSELKVIANNNPLQGNGFIYSFIECKGAIDYVAIPELKFINLEQYRKESIKIWKLEKE